MLQLYGVKPYSTLSLVWAHLGTTHRGPKPLSHDGWTFLMDFIILLACPYFGILKDLKRQPLGDTNS